MWELIQCFMIRNEDHFHMSAIYVACILLYELEKNAELFSNFSALTMLTLILSPRQEVNCLQQEVSFSGVSQLRWELPPDPNPELLRSVQKSSYCPYSAVETEKAYNTGSFMYSGTLCWLPPTSFLSVLTLSVLVNN